jgi:hypothetical protein
MGAQKERGSGEARNENENRNYDDEMGDPGIHTGRDHVTGRMRKEEATATATATTRADCSDSLAVSESKHSE